MDPLYQHYFGRRAPVAAVIVDMQCFKNDKKELVVKEVCVLDVNSGAILMHHIAQPPTAEQHFGNEDTLRENRWLSKHCHGLTWNSGDISYTDLLSKLRYCLSARTTVYIKGDEKRMWLLRHVIDNPFSTQVMDTAEMGCGSLQSIGNLLSITSTVRCGQHKSNTSRCALANCTLLRGWLLLTTPRHY